VHSHHKYTGSAKAKKVLDDLSNEIKRFVKVMPKEYKRVLKGMISQESPELAEVADG